MTVHLTEGERSHDGELTAAISTAMVQIVRDYTGRGPTKARTTIRDSVVLVILEDTLTRGERALVAYGKEDKVLDIRLDFQDAMRDEAMQTVAQLTGCAVLAMMSASHIEPDFGAKVFVLDGAPTR